MIAATLCAVTEEKDTDWNVMLQHVYPDGRAERIQDGPFRWRCHRLLNPSPAGTRRLLTIYYSRALIGFLRSDGRLDDDRTSSAACLLSMEVQNRANYFNPHNFIRFRCNRLCASNLFRICVRKGSEAKGQNTLKRRNLLEMTAGDPVR